MGTKDLVLKLKKNQKECFVGREGFSEGPLGRLGNNQKRMVYDFFSAGIS
jgi:hypothetical protein